MNLNEYEQLVMEQQIICDDQTYIITYKHIPYTYTCRKCEREREREREVLNSVRCVYHKQNIVKRERQTKQKT